MANPAIVETKLGKLLGTASTTRYLREYFSFQGVRYAKPPIGDLRFKVRTFVCRNPPSQMAMNPILFYAQEKTKL